MAIAEGKPKSRPHGKAIAGLALGVLAGIGGFVDTGGVITATDAGASFHYSLAWTVVFGMIGFALFAEMSGRVAMSSTQPTWDVMRTRLGPKIGAIPLVISLVIHVLTLAVDLVGMGLALQLLLGVSYRVWVAAVALVLIVALWRFNFTAIDTGAALLGLLMLVAVAAMIKLSPDWGAMAKGLITPQVHEAPSNAKYLFGIAALLGAFMTPYQFDFYSSGVIEERWAERDLMRNRVVAITGTAFGAVVTLGLMAAGGKALYNRDVPVDTIRHAASPTAEAFGHTGLYLFIIGVLAVSLAASIELCLSGGYAMCQYYGWDWGKSAPARKAPAFNLIYVAMILVAAVIVLLPVNPISFTTVTMALGAAALPFTFIPLLLIANDRRVMGRQRNTRATNVLAIIVLSVLVCITVMTVPLLVITHGSF